ncbi:RNA polymerase factor sigma-54 [Tepidimonas charontis]|uniref:RNA polymerase sigma-54 factor n=1 Tax=Tepidimonas charontis TaxID=2267262 RepID=A0A554XIK0_9BURK|nr:RNA polymerase factor sigma-54 [Tepidimonas charontis]TSE35642.1 RNA polymerase sigma-54 factor [Tepidimonas charontis]
MRSGLSLRQTQQLTLTPQLQQSIRLLQMSTLEVAQEIEQMLADNPFLERVDDEGTLDADDLERSPTAASTDAPSASAQALHSDAAPDAAEAATEERDDDGAAALPDALAPFESERALASDDWPAQLDEDAGGWREADEEAAQERDWSWDGPGGARGANDAGDEPVSALALARTSERLQDHLHRQALALHLTPEERAALYYLIESLDEDGYLTDPLEELADALLRGDAGTGADDPLPSGEAQAQQREEVLSLLRRALGWLQAMEPAGVGARHLAECLRLQLLEHPNTPVTRTALALCEQPLEWLARRDVRRLAQACGADEATVRAALHVLTRLEPKPGRRFADTQGQIIVPDVIVTVRGAEFDVQLNPDVLPRLRVADVYARALRGHRGGDLPQRLQEARWFIKNLQQRFDTILRVARAIVAHQRSFFLHGEVGMRPLVLRDIAAELGLHESTISRVTSAKYMATPFGTFELKYFFGSSLGTDTGGNASSTAVRALIRQLIAGEDPQHPLSDGRIAELLREQGIECARRTVAKYREALRIPTASLRKAPPR